MTGYSSTASAIEALRLGADDYLECGFKERTTLRPTMAELERFGSFSKVEH